MVKYLLDLVTNPVLITALSSFLLAQILKLIIHTIIYRKFEIMRLFGDGGMPSGHSAMVSSAATICGLICGFGSIEFAISATLAFIVCHDAKGVRRETGKQAVVLNELLKTLGDMTKEKITDVKLKEFVGHSPVQIAAGVCTGITNAFFMNFVVFA
ncbi:MAG: divergent PAP2 family protein [Clostridia bacterium]|nr:divergent PAP2 family protein [Clostridia bacterium]